MKRQLLILSMLLFSTLTFAQSEIIFDVEKATTKNGITSVPVKINAAEAVFSVSFSVIFDNSKCEYISVGTHASYISATPNLVEGNKIALVSNTKSVPYESGSKLFSINFNVENNDSKNISLQPVTSKVNGDEAKAIARVTGIPTAIDDVDDEERIKIYPIPASYSFTIDVHEDAIAELFDVNGVSLLTTKVHTGVNKIDVNDLTSGVYILKIYNQYINSTKQIIIN